MDWESGSGPHLVKSLPGNLLSLPPPPSFTAAEETAGRSCGAATSGCRSIIGKQVGYRICAAVIVLKGRKVRRGTGTAWRVGIKVVGEGLTDNIHRGRTVSGMLEEQTEDPCGRSRGREGGSEGRV